MTPDISSFKDLESATEFTQLWLPKFTFAVESLSAGERAALAEVAGIQVHFERADTDVLGFVTEFLIGSGRQNRLIVLEHRSQPRSRVRSYKGLFWDNQQIRRGEHKEYEFDLSAAYTQLVGTVVVTPANAAECMYWFADGTRSFIVSADAQTTSSEALARDALESVDDLPGRAYVNYAKLVSRVCPRGDRVLRMAGYSGEGDATVQAFTSVSDIEVLAREFQSTLWKTEL
jgi:hypothetical protein